MSDPVPGMEDVLEPIVAQLKEELENTGLFADISEGETVYTQDKGTIAWVIPGVDTIRHTSTRGLEHNIMIYIIILNMDQNATLSELRATGEEVYNYLMRDVTHGGTCWVCIPRRFHPGFMQYGDASYCGVLMTFEARVQQKF
jgi:hypothetical protein